MKLAGERLVIKAPREVVSEVYEINVDPEKEEFIVENFFTAISSGTELSIYTGANPRTREPGSWCYYPHLPGYAGVGRVVKSGSGPVTVREGDLIFHHAHHSSFDILHSSTSQYAKIPPDLLRPDAALVRFAAIVQSGAVRPCEIKDGYKVALLGLGLIGQMAAQLFSLAGAEVYAIEPIGTRREVAKRVGACKEILEPGQSESAGNADILVDATGLSSVIISSLGMVRQMGQVILLGTPFVPYQSDVTEFLRAIHLKRLTVRGALERDQASPEGPNDADTYAADLKHLISLVSEGRLKTRELLSSVVRPFELARAYDSLESQKEKFLSTALDWRRS